LSFPTNRVVEQQAYPFFAFDLLIFDGLLAGKYLGSVYGNSAFAWRTSPAQITRAYSAASFAALKQKVIRPPGAHSSLAGRRS
jgi:hypothetical protein